MCWVLLFFFALSTSFEKWLYSLYVIWKRYAYSMPEPNILWTCTKGKYALHAFRFLSKFEKSLVVFNCRIWIESIKRILYHCHFLPNWHNKSPLNPILRRYMCCLCRSIFFIHRNDLKILPPLYVLQSCITNAFLLSFQSTLLLCLTSVYNLRKSNDTRTFQPLPRLSTYLISVVLFVPFLSSEKQPCHLLLVN